MNGNLSRGVLLAMGALTLLGLLCAWTAWYRYTAEQRLANDQENLSDCREFASKIERLRLQKQRALLETKPSDELNRKVEALARQTGIDIKALERIDPQEPRRVGDTQYLEQVTEIEILAVPLKQLLRFAQLAESTEEGLILTSVRLTPPRNTSGASTDAEPWNAELALTYLVYSPKSRPR